MKFRSSTNPTGEMPFLDHLEELRWRILWSLIALLVCSLIAFFFVMSYDIIGLLKKPIEPYLTANDGKLIILGVTDGFFISFKLAIAMGVVAAFPIIFYNVWAFLSPALMPKEKRAIVPALYLGFVLFAAGVALAYLAALPFTLKFMLTFKAESLTPQITAPDYFSFVVKLMLGFGVMFELPVVIMVLTAIGLASSKFLASKRRYAVGAMAILAAMITPGDAITATLILMGPLMLLYELSIILAKLVERGRRKSLESVAEDSDALTGTVG